jgi:hypothetical protein
MKRQIFQRTLTKSYTLFYCHHLPSVTACFLFRNDKNLDVNLLRTIVWAVCRMDCISTTYVLSRSSAWHMAHDGGVDVSKIHFSEFFLNVYNYNSIVWMKKKKRVT